MNNNRNQRRYTNLNDDRNNRSRSRSGRFENDRSGRLGSHRSGRFENDRNDRYDNDRNRTGSSRGNFRHRGDDSRLIASDRVEGTPVYDRDGERLGTIENFMVGKRSGRVEYAVLSFGGFLGIGERHYPLPWDELDYDEDEGGYVVDITEDDLDRAPSHRAGSDMNYERGYGHDVRHYYGSH
jgi:hypothetical protein